ncbi:MAG TPA: hypothetical protein VNG33_09195 [Polyangiaceae bacterium]|nr:hypothetical protein [Polyangiaceae bacterium]
MNAHNDALSRAFSAYADATAGEALDAQRVRARILVSARRANLRSLRRLSFVLPLVAVFAASAAFAAREPRLRAALATRVEQLLGRKSTAPHAAAPFRRPAPAAPPATETPRFETPASPAKAASGEAPAPIAIEALPLAEPAPANASGLRPSAPRPDARATSAPEAAVTDAASAELAAYRSAHRTHFDGGSPAASLLAWDHYLEDFPAGSFADDARFNRALCLIRLGRHADARTALQPFAAAPAGAYRQSEAASLLGSLRAAQP